MANVLSTDKRSTHCFAFWEMFAITLVFNRGLVGVSSQRQDGSLPVFQCRDWLYPQRRFTPKTRPFFGKETICPSIYIISADHFVTWRQRANDRIDSKDIPEEKHRPYFPPSKAAMQSCNAVLVGCVSNIPKANLLDEAVHRLRFEKWVSSPHL